MIKHRSVFLFSVSIFVASCSGVMHLKNNYKAVNAFYNNDLPQAQQLFEELIAANADDYAAQYNAGKVFYAQKNFEKAEAYFDHVAKHEVNKQLQIQSYFDCGNAQVKQKKWDEALQSYEQVLQRDPHHEKAAEMIEKLQAHKKNQPLKQPDQTPDQKKDAQKKPDDKSQDSSHKNKEKQEQSADNQQSDNQKSDKKNERGAADENQSPSSSNEQKQRDDQKKNEGIPNKQGDDKQDMPGQSQGDVRQRNDHSDQREEQAGNQPDNQAQKQAGQKGLEQNDQKHTDQQRNRKEKSGDSGERQQANGARNDAHDNKHAEAEKHKVEHGQSPAMSENNIKNSYNNDKENKGKAQDEKALLQDQKGFCINANKNEPDTRLSNEENALLQAVEDHDAHTTKILIKNNIKKGMPAQHGYKNW